MSGPETPSRNMGPPPDLRRLSIMNSALKNQSPLRRRTLLLQQTPNDSNNSVLCSSHLDLAVDEEEERNNRRTLNEMRERISNITNSSNSLRDSFQQLMSEDELQQHLGLCFQLFNNNKISLKNAWSLRIIDGLSQIVNQTKENIIQVAGTSLEISSKVYSLRVDDTYTSALKLAAALIPSAEFRVPNEQESDDDTEQQNGDNPADGQQKKQTKRKRPKLRITTGLKPTVGDEDLFLDELPRMESAEFTTREDIDVGASDNLFTLSLPMDPVGYRFKSLNPTEKNRDNSSDLSVQNSKLWNVELPEFTYNKICSQFNDFVLDEWDPDGEDKSLHSQRSFCLPTEVALDDQGVPVHELDSSIHDFFADNDHSADENDENRDLNNAEIVQENECQMSRAKRPRIETLIPEEFRQENEYGYGPSSVQMCRKSKLDQLWAGPAYWKLSCVRSEPACFTGSKLGGEQSRKKKKKTEKEKLIDLDQEIDERLFVEQNKKKKRPYRKYKESISLPTVRHILRGFEGSYDLRPDLNAVILGPEGATGAVASNTATETAAEVYNYDNQNDSFYCSENNDNGGNDNVFDDQDNSNPAPQNFLDGNLVDAPQLVEDNYVNYVKHAKKMDMKKLKNATWKVLTHQEELIESIQDDEHVVEPTTFSDTFKGVLEICDANMRSALSTPLLLASVLTLCNEKSLILEPYQDNDDFKIASDLSK